MKVTDLLRITSCVFMMLSGSSVCGQQVREIKIGDRLPDIIVSNLWGKSDSDISLDELRSGGMLLIDFWATWCSPCIQDMKTLDTIKELLPFPLAHLSITHQDSSEVSRFFSSGQSEALDAEKLLIATNDTVLNQNFKHKFLPHYVWVDASGRVGAITGSDALTVSNFTQFQETGRLEARAKSDRVDYHPSAPFHLGDSIFSYRAIITPYIPGIGSTDLIWTAGGGGSSRYVRRYLKNNGILTQFYRTAYDLMQGRYDANYRPELIEIHTADSLRYFYPSDNQFGKLKHLLDDSPYKDKEEWEKANQYTYELCLPHPAVDSVFGRYMLEDLNRFFKVKATIETRERTCWTIRYNGENDGQLVPTGNSSVPPHVIFSNNRDSLIARNVTIDQFFAKLLAKYSSSDIGLPFVLEGMDTLSYRFNLTLSLASHLERIREWGIDFDIVKIELEKIGFSFSKGRREYPILVLRDADME